jgi:hypothetical protein
MMKSRRMGLEEDAKRMGVKRSTWRILAGNPEGETIRKT